MRRLLFAAIAVGVLSIVGVSFAQEKSVPQMPRKVRGFLDNLIGNWNVEGAFKGEVSYRWDSGNNYVIGRAEGTIGGMPFNDTSLHRWDGASDDRIVTYGASSGGHIVRSGKVVSETVMEGEETGFMFGREATGEIRIEHQGPGKMKVLRTHLFEGGVEQPEMSFVFTRVNNASDGLAMLKHLAGNWVWAGEQVDIDTDDSPYGQGGKFSGSSESRLVLGGRFLLGEWQEKSPEGNVLRGINLTGYDAKKQSYVTYSFMSDGSTDTGSFTLEGRIARNQSTMTTGTGKKLLVKTERKFARNWKRQEGRQEISTDNGKTWKHWAEFVIEKSGDADRPVNTSTNQTLTNEVELVDMGGKRSKAEMQVWKTVKAYWNVETIDELMAYNHAEFMGWSTAEPMPSNKAATRLWLGNLLSNRKSEITTITPTGLKIHGNVAIANYYYSQLYKDMDGKQQTEQGRFTDILLKEKGKWLLIGDHGGATPTNGK